MQPDVFRLDRVDADRLSAVAAGIQSIARGAAGPLRGGAVHETIVEFEHAILFVMSVSDSSALAVTATRPCDVGLIGYEMAVLVERVGNVVQSTRRAPSHS